MVPNRTELVIHEMRRQDTFAEVARERRVEEASHRAPSPGPSGPPAAPSVGRSLRAAVAARLAWVRRWAHVG